MSTSHEFLSKLSKEDLIGTVQALEDSLAEAATGLMKEGSAQEYAALRVRYAIKERDVSMLGGACLDYEERIARLPRLIRWWYGC